MELRVHGGPALLFPSFTDTLCWEQFLPTVNQLLLLGSTELRSDLPLPAWDRMTEVSWRGCRSLDLLGHWLCQSTAACEHHWGAWGSWASPGRGGEWVLHCAGAGVRMLRAPRARQEGAVAPGTPLPGT